MVRMSNVVECPSVSVLLSDLGQQGGVLKLIKNTQFLVLLAVRVFLSNILCRLRSSLY